MSILDHIALALDFSEPSEVAARATFKLAALAGTERITIVHACQHVVLPRGASERLLEKLEKTQRKVVDAATAQIRELCARLGAPPVEIEVVAGRPTDVIPATAQRIGADVLVVGTHARRGIKRMFMGSVAETLVRGLELPCLVMHVGGDGVAPDEELAHFDNALVAVDLTEAAEGLVETAVDFVRRLRGDRRADLTLVHVLDEHSVAPDQKLLGAGSGALVLDEFRVHTSEVAARLLAQLRDRHASEQLGVDVRIAEGRAADVVVELAAESKAELVVIGTHGRGLAPLHELGTTTERVMRSSPVVVLVVPSRGTPV